jgi:hypothetical protein
MTPLALGLLIGFVAGLCFDALVINRLPLALQPADKNHYDSPDHCA